jgi:arylsulfatase
MVQAIGRSNAAGPLVLAMLLILLSAIGCEPDRSPIRLVLLLSVDTLRADHLGAYGNELGLTPHVDALAAESQIFEWAYAPTSFTLPSVSSLLTGRYPEEIGILGNRSALAPEVPTVASVLREHGWHTAAVVSNLVLRKSCGLDRGFDSYDDVLSSAEATRQWPERIATDTTDAAVAVLGPFLANADDRLFLWVHYQDPHGPYTPPEALREKFLPAERSRDDGRRRLSTGGERGGRGRIPDYQVIDGRREVAFYRAGYDAEVHFLDREVGRLLHELEGHRVADATMIIFTADHGESLGERDYWFAHGARLDDSLVRVPLLIRVPGGLPGRRQDVVSLLDIYPTLLQRVAGLPPGYDAVGRDLLAPDAAGTASEPYLATLRAGSLPRLGIVTQGHKLILTKQRQGWRSELFRLGREDHDLAHSDPDRVASMRASLTRLRSGLSEGRVETRQRLSEADERRLRALGYVETSTAPEGEQDSP